MLLVPRVLSPTTVDLRQHKPGAPKEERLAPGEA